MKKIYKVINLNPDMYDYYDAIVIVATSASEAKTLSIKRFKDLAAWPMIPSRLYAKLVGTSNRKIGTLILASYNAG